MRPLALTAAVCLALIAAPGAQAAFPGADGAVVYVGTRDGRTALFERGRIARQLPAVSGAVADPAFSPLGRRIAFTRALSTGRGVWVTDLDGANLRRVTRPGRRSEDPAWSPAGDRIAFTAGPPGRRRIAVIGADGNGLRRLTTSPREDTSAAWSVEDEIAFVRHRPTGDDLYVVQTSGGRAVRLTRSKEDEAAPAWSPDGRTLAFIGGPPARRGLYVLRPGGSARRLASVSGPDPSPAWAPSGTKLVFSSGAPGARRLYTVPAGGGAVAPFTFGGADAHAPDWQPAGADPVIATAGDIACDPLSSVFASSFGAGNRCAMRRTSNLLLRRDLWAVLALGDLQYEDGQLWKFQRSFGPTWGRLGTLLRPVPGNHEYRVPNAQGYFDYFLGPGVPSGAVGDRAGGFYSFDVGTWHVVALNSNCADIAVGCAAGSAQERWLREDLAAHPARCTLAFWHHPTFTGSGEGDQPAAQAFWQALYEAGADVVLNGHAHDYERLAPQDPSGARDEARGLHQFIVGTGGRNLLRPARANPNRLVVSTATYGVLQLTLRPDSFSWEFLPTQAGRQSDTGSAPCH